MQCEYKLCIYNHNDKCIFDESIRINSAGVCDGCIQVLLDSDFLDEVKERQLDRLDESLFGWHPWEWAPLCLYS